MTHTYTCPCPRCQSCEPVELLTRPEPRCGIATGPSVNVGLLVVLVSVGAFWLGGFIVLWRMFE